MVEVKREHRRAGTENIAGIVGLGKAIEFATENLKEERERLTYLRDKLINGLLEKFHILNLMDLQEIKDFQEM